jgi:hypothetical protein
VARMLLHLGACLHLCLSNGCWSHTLCLQNFCGELGEGERREREGILGVEGRETSCCCCLWFYLHFFLLRVGMGLLPYPFLAWDEDGTISAWPLLGAKVLIMSAPPRVGAVGVLSCSGRMMAAFGISVTSVTSVMSAAYLSFLLVVSAMSVISVCGFCHICHFRQGYLPFLPFPSVVSAISASCFLSHLSFRHFCQGCLPFLPFLPVVSVCHRCFCCFCRFCLPPLFLSLLPCALRSLPFPPSVCRRRFCRFRRADGGRGRAAPLRRVGCPLIWSQSY